MPTYDGQGPYWGGGPGAGWGRGPCGAGYGRRWGRRFMHRWTKEDEMKALDQEEEMLKEELAAIRKYKEEFNEKK